MKVMLIYPPLTPGAKSRYGLQPLGVLYLAATLKREGVPVRVLDAEILGMTLEEAAAQVLKEQPDLVGLSAMTPQYPLALELARALKRRAPGLAICIGGAHVNATHDEALRLCDALDFAVYGEGERTLAEAVAALSRGAGLGGVAGVIHRAGGGCRRNPPRPFVQALDELPFPDLGMLPLGLYEIPYLPGKPIASMILSRGCPYRCAFCDAHVTQGKTLRNHSVEAIMREISLCVRRLGIRNFAFKDSTLTLDRRWCLALARRIADSGLGIRYRCNTRVDRIDEELLAAFKASGCTMILFGVESGAQAILDGMRKGITVAQIEEAFRLTSRYGIRTYASFMLGNPGETADTARETIELAKRINPDMVLFFFTTAYPGTELYDQALRAGLVSPGWWMSEKHFDSQYAFSKWLSGEGGKLRIKGFDTSLWLRRAYRSYYFRLGYLWKVVKSLLRDPRYLRILLQLMPDLLRFSHRRAAAGAPLQPGETSE